MYENQGPDIAKKINAALGKEGMAPAPLPTGLGNDYSKVPAGIYEVGTSGQRRYTRAEMHEKAASSESLAASRNLSAAQFLRAHPEFETFLDLIRDGAITLY